VTVIRQLDFSEGKGGDDVGSVSSVRGKRVKMRTVLFLVKTRPCYKTYAYYLLFLKLASRLSFVSLDLENGRIPSEGQQIVNQLEEKLNSINKFATEAYNSIISNAQVVLKCYSSLCMCLLTLVICVCKYYK